MMRDERPDRRLGTTFLDGMRGMAAGYVLVHHADYLLRRGYLLQLHSYGKLIDSDSYHRGLTLTMSFFRWGHAAVVFFFVLSGFLIHLRQSRQFVDAAGAGNGGQKPQALQFALKDYAWHRIRRIYPPLLAALALTAGLDSLGAYLGFTPYSGKTPYSWIHPSTDHRPSTLLASVLLSNATLFGFGTNAPLWSLACEGWYYALYPLLWHVWRRSLTAATAAVLLLSGLTLLPVPWPESAKIILGGLPAWWIGTLLADVYSRRIRISFGWLAPLTGVLACTQMRSLPEPLRNALLAVGFAGLISLAFYWERRGRRLALLERLKPLGNFSYSLYVMHFPVLVFLCGAYLKFTSPPHLPDAPWFMMAGIMTAAAVAWAAHWVVEVPFVGAARPRGRPEPVPLQAVE